MKVELHAEALAELLAAAEYYEFRSPGLGTRFLDLFAEALGRIARDPFAWTPVDEDVRRCLTRLFPYKIYYSIEQDFVLILAVAHAAREPGYWEKRR